MSPDFYPGNLSQLVNVRAFKITTHTTKKLKSDRILTILYSSLSPDQSQIMSALSASQCQKPPLREKHLTDITIKDCKKR